MSRKRKTHCSKLRAQGLQRERRGSAELGLMASDWIKMKTDLYRSHRVSTIADALMDPESELSRHVHQNCQRYMAVTRNVTRNAVVGALVSVWGVARHRGEREGDDLRLRSASLQAVDDMADMPGFAMAMLDAGWLTIEGDDLLFPCFFARNNVDPHRGLARKRAGTGPPASREETRKR